MYYMGLFDLLGIHGAVAPISSFIEMVKMLRRNKDDENDNGHWHHNDKR